MPPGRSPGAFERVVSESGVRFRFGSFLTRFGGLPEAEFGENLRFAILEVVLLDVAGCELLVLQAELLEQRILVGARWGLVVGVRGLAVSYGELLGLALLLAELSLTLLIGLWASSQSERLLRRL